MKSMLTMVLFLIAPMAAIAQDAVPLQKIVEQQERLRNELADGLDGATPRQTRIIRKAQDEFFAITEGVQSLDQLSIQDKVRVKNALDSITAQVVNTSASRSDQEVCWREARVGSKTKVTHCGTKEEIEQLRRDSVDAMERDRVCDASNGVGNCGTIPDPPQARR